MKHVKFVNNKLPLKTSELTLSANNFKSLIFVQGLLSARDAEIRRRLLNKLENEPNITLQQIAEDCQRFVSVRQDSKKIEESGIVHIINVRQKKKQSISPTISNQYKKKQKNLSPNPCSGCGSLHWCKNCPYRNKNCQTYSLVGHQSSQARARKGLIAV